MLFVFAVYNCTRMELLKRIPIFLTRIAKSWYEYLKCYSCQLISWVKLFFSKTRIVEFWDEYLKCYSCQLAFCQLELELYKFVGTWLLKLERFWWSSNDDKNMNLKIKILGQIPDCIQYVRTFAFKWMWHNYIQYEIYWGHWYGIVKIVRANSNGAFLWWNIFVA
jgi:hypothetical protein